VRPLLLVLFLAGCAGITEPYNRITGFAPEDGSCRVDILDRDTQKVIHSEQVRGKFSVGFGLNKDSPRRVDILAVCNDRITKELRRVTPGSLGMTDLGAIGP
jgi:hypothetical protein